MSRYEASHLQATRQHTTVSRTSITAFGFIFMANLYDIHAIAILMFERHTSLNMYGLVTKFLHIICPSWRNKLLGLAADGASVMTGEFKGVVTRLENEIPHKVY